MKKLVLVIGIGFFLYAFCLSKTDGFSMRKIHSTLSYHPEWETQNAPIDPSIDQPFYYLGHGAQVYAFESADKKVVLKFYRHNRAGHALKPISFLLPPFLQSRLFQTVEKRRAKRAKDFMSYTIAAEKFAEEAGLLYVHLNKSSNLRKKVVLFDKIGVRHILDLDQFEFLLQKRASLIYPSLETWISEGAYAPARRALTSLISVLRSRCEKGIFDKDPNLMTNFGFIGEKAIQFDIGRFKEDISQTDPKIQREELRKATDPLRIWLEEKAPELAAHLHEEIDL